MNRIDFDHLMTTLRTANLTAVEPLVDCMIKEFGHDPFIIIVSCLLSLRARDATTIHVCRVLFNKIRTPQELLALPVADLEQIIYKTGYYKVKAQVLINLSHLLISKYQGKVPRILEELMSIKGVGIKTANLVLGLAFNEPAICVDTHVHRISNRLGVIKTKTPEQTEEALRKVLPRDYWIEWNKQLVMFGQTQCVPISPKCSTCPLRPVCPRIGVTKSR
jgi:endonuclease III